MSNKIFDILRTVCEIASGIVHGVLWFGRTVASSVCQGNLRNACDCGGVHRSVHQREEKTV